MIAEIGQQLVWLSAALRSSPSSNQPSYCTPEITFRDGMFTISFQYVGIDIQQLGARVTGACWLPLFKNPVIVQGFPILARLQAEKGLEIPLNMMAGLGEASRVTIFDGGLLVKGFSTLFCPMKRLKRSVLWHYLFEQEGGRISYLAASDRCPERALLRNVDNACLPLSRHFLGWTSSVEIRAGTADVKYEEIKWPGTNLASAGIAIEKASIVLGNYISGGVSFTRGNKDTPIYLSRVGPYQQEIHSAHNMKVVLYDVEDRRGWLVDGTNALLHLTRAQLGSSPYSDSDLFNLNNFVHADPAAGSCAAKKALLDSKNRDLLIFEEKENGVTRKWTYQDLVRQTYHVLEQMHDYEGKILTSSNISIRWTDRDKLLGFAFMDIVDGQNDLRPRVASLKSSGKGWVDLTRSVRAITLLGKGFGEIIRPSKDSNKLCKDWRQVPKGKDYLVACTSTLRDICKRQGNHESRPMELASGIYWHKPDKLFEPCDGRESSFSGCCDRVQVLLPPSLGSARHPQPFGHQNGAVIFGRTKRLPWRWSSKGEAVEGEQSDSEHEDGSSFNDSGLGGNIPSQSGSSVSGNADSSTSISSDPRPCVTSPKIATSESINEDESSLGRSENDLPETTQLSGNTMTVEIRQDSHPTGSKRVWSKVKDMATDALPRKKVKGSNREA
jgi:hypothetical protein